MRKNLLCVVLLLASFNTWAGGGFMDIRTSCRNLKLEKASLRAECTAKNGGVYQSSIRLRGVHNKNGTLIYDGGTSAYSKFHVSCKDASVDARGILSAQCLTESSTYLATTLDLAKIVANYNGALVFPLKNLD